MPSMGFTRFRVVWRRRLACPAAELQGAPPKFELVAGPAILFLLYAIAFEKMPIKLMPLGAIRGKKGVNYPILMGRACDYVKSRVASGGLTIPP
jgi:hypothetical protein